MTHPVVRRNPDSGRPCLFVNADFTRNIQGVDRHEARGILNFLLDWLKKPEFMVHHQWEAGGIAVWDGTDWTDLTGDLPEATDIVSIVPVDAK